LQTLHLGDNRIGREGGLALANATWIDSIQHLQLWANPLGGEAKRALKSRLGARVHL
jgi:hypothetical protein